MPSRFHYKRPAYQSPPDSLDKLILSDDSQAHLESFDDSFVLVCGDARVFHDLVTFSRIVMCTSSSSRGNVVLHSFIV